MSKQPEQILEEQLVAQLQKLGNSLFSLARSLPKGDSCLINKPVSSRRIDCTLGATGCKPVYLIDTGALR